MPFESQRVLLIGCGSIGGVLGTLLCRAGVDLTIATTNEAVRSAWTKQGPRLDGKPGTAPLPPSRVIASARELDTPVDLALVAVQPPQMDEVVASLEGRLSPSGCVVCLANGLCEEFLAARLGEERVIGAVVAWGARMLAPGDYLRTSAGGFRVGRLSGLVDRRVGDVAELLGLVGPVAITSNLRGARFTKLAINCAVSTLGTIGGTTVGELLSRGDVRSLALDILSEAVRVAHAAGIALEPVAGFDLSWLVPNSSRQASRWPRAQSAMRHALLVAIGLRYKNLRSSMLAAIERGRAPAVDYLNGEIAARGRALGVPTPVNEAARAVVWEIATGQRASGAGALRRVRELALRTRPEESPATA